MNEDRFIIDVEAKTIKIREGAVFGSYLEYYAAFMAACLESEHDIIKLVEVGEEQT